jgi:undecaprenyl-diphosphatase
MWIFAAVTEDVVSDYSLERFDLVLSQWFRAHATHFGDFVFDTVTQFGSASVVTILVLGVAAILVIRRQWIVLTGWLAAAAGSGALSVALKLLIQRPRPAVATVHLGSWSFPSGHAMASLITYGMLAYLLLQRTPRPGPRLAILSAAALLIAAIGFSRLYLGLHYFSDVVGGYAAGTVWLTACVSGLEIVRRRPEVRRGLGTRD